MISYFTANGGYYIGEVQNEVIAENGSGIIEVSPPPFVPHSSTPDLRLSHAVGEFIMVDGPSGTESYSAKTYRFSAQQVLR